MNIFNKRPLCIILSIMLGGFVFGYYAGAWIKLAVIASIAALFSALFLRSVRNRIKTALIKNSLVFLLISILLSHLYFDVILNFEDRFPDEAYIVGEISDMSTSGGSATLELKTESVNDAPISSYKLLVYVDTDKYYGYSIGSKISFYGKIEDIRKSASFDGSSYYTARGIFGIVCAPYNLTIIEASNRSLTQRITEYRQALARRLVINTDRENGGLLSALLLGEQSYLPGEVKLDFSRSGLSHLLALSGLHVSILILGLMKLLAKIGLDKRICVLVAIPATFGYMALTGFPVSVVRAGLMLIIYSLLFLLSRERDSITSLFISVFIICVIEPYAILDLSLWLSAFATLGIVASSEFKDLDRISKLIKKILSPFVYSFFAIFATSILTVSRFNSQSFIGFLTTPIFSVLIEIFLYIGTAVMLFGSLIPIGRILTPLGNFIMKCLAYVSSINSVCTSTNFPIVKILGVCLGIAFILFLVVKIKKRILYLLSMLLLFSITMTYATVMTKISEGKTEILYTCTDKSEGIIISSGSNIAVSDMSAYNKNSSYEILDTLEELKLTRIDTYIISEYTSRLSEALKVLGDNVKISSILLPTPKTAYEEDTYKIICADFENRRTRIITYSEKSYFKIGQIGYSTEMLDYDSNGDYTLLVNLFHGEETYSFTTANTLNSNRKVDAREAISKSQALTLLRYQSSGTYKLLYEFGSFERLLYHSKNLTIPTEMKDFYSDCEIYCDITELSLIR